MKKALERFDRLALKGWRPYAWLLILCYALYVRTTSFHLTFLDDDYFLARLGFLKDWHNLYRCFYLGSLLERSGGIYYRPMIIVTMILDAMRLSDSLAAFYLTNILLHAACTMLCFVFLERLPGRDGSSRRTNFFLAAIFGAHPLLVEAVAWIPGRTDSLLAFFALLSIIAFADYLSKRKPAALAAHSFFLLLALLTKELAVVIPSMCVAYALCFCPMPSRRRWSFAALAWAAAFAVAYFLRRLAFAHGEPYRLNDIIRCVWHGLPAAIVYLGKIFFLWHLSPYPILRDGALWPGILAVGALLALLVADRAAARERFLFGIFWFCACLLPSFYFPDADVAPVFFEYRAYLPLIGVLIFLSGFSYCRVNTALRTAAASALTALLAVVAGVYLGVYHDALRFWTAGVEGAPHSAVAHKQLGAAYLVDNRFAAAEPELLAALELNPKEPLVHNNLANLYAMTGRADRSEAELRLELEIDPASSRALFNLGVLRMRGRHDREAVALWKDAIRADPEYLRPYRTLAQYFYEHGSSAEAQAYARQLAVRGAETPEWYRPDGGATARP